MAEKNLYALAGIVAERSEGLFHSAEGLGQVIKK